MLSFFEGIIAALGALVLELTLPFFNLPANGTSLIFIFLAAAIEEILKYAFIYNNYLKLPIKEKIVKNSFFIGLGFAATEIFLKQLPLEKTNWLPILGVFLIHLFTASLAGFFLLKKYSKLMKAKKGLSPEVSGLSPFSAGGLSSSKIIIFNVLLHFAYNFLILRYF